MINSYGMSDVGLVRNSNEDSYALDPERGLFVVADGMGGAQAGETASRIAVETLSAEIRRAGADAPPEALIHAVELANENIREAAERNPAHAGMGTTVVAVLVRLPKVYVANVGDSRGYLWTHGELFCVTSDDTWVNQVGRGLGLSDEQLRKHPYRNVLTRAVGAEDHIEVKVQEIGLLPGDMLLLCSDGLHTVTGEDALLEVLEKPGSLQQKCEALIAAAIAKGAPDNVTAVLIEASEGLTRPAEDATSTA
jgi:protein phosphatase